MRRPSPFFALTTYGLETISADEARPLPGVTIADVAYRRIVGECAAPGDLLGLRAVDDVFLTLATWRKIERTRATLTTLHDLSRELAFDEPLRIREQILLSAQTPRASRPPTFSVTASFVGARRYSAEEIKRAVADGVSQANGWRYEPDDRHADLNLRLFIDHAMALVGVRLGQRPLHERGYRRAQRPGALKPTVAAAMVRLADVAPGRRLLDPCCGSGTIVIEAALAGVDAWGGDSDADAIAAARTNALAAGVQMTLTRMDVRSLPMPSGSVEAVVTNLPWGRQAPVGGDLARFYARALAELRRVLAPGGRLVALTTHPSLMRHPGLRLAVRYDISLSGQRPSILVFSGV